MSARDDYPFHAALETLNAHSLPSSALDEIDRLRDELTTIEADADYWAGVADECEVSRLMNTDDLDLAADKVEATGNRKDASTIRDAAKALDRAIRYVRDTDDLTEMAKRGASVFGKRWQDVIGFKPTSVTP